MKYDSSGRKNLSKQTINKIETEFKIKKKWTAAQKDGSTQEKSNALFPLASYCLLSIGSAR